MSSGELYSDVLYLPRVAPPGKGRMVLSIRG